MNRSNSVIQHWHEPDPGAIATDIEGFLRQLSGPTAFTFAGRDSSRWRAIVTLLHGNEPSGLLAFHQWLRHRRQPAVNILCILGSVRAALHEGLFQHRMLPGQRDLNRCFRPPYERDEPGRIAAAILQTIERYRPECLIDIHNTSGRSGSFGVVTHEDPVHETLVALFTRRLIVTDIELGALMEISEARCPAVTIECGGADDLASADIARRGLDRYLHEDVITEPPQDSLRMDVYHRPVRLELEQDCSLVFADMPQPEADVTVPPDIERLNFGVIGPEVPIAWLGRRGTAALRLRDAHGRNLVDSYFMVRGDRLYPSRQMKLFMVTTNPLIASSDCLFYATAESRHTVIDVSEEGKDER